MTIELKLQGNLCNLGCDYCYQDPMRRAGNERTTTKYDLELMLEIAEMSGSERKQLGYTLFGGEPLINPKKDLEIVFEQSFRLYGQSNIQTNGSLIDDDHIKLFKKYHVNVGVSIDGPDELNDMRVPKIKGVSVRRTTQDTIRGLQKLSEHGIQAGVILTVHQLNGKGNNLDTLMSFIRELGDMGHKSGNIHMLEVDSIKAYEYCLTATENEYAFQRLAEFFDLKENQDLYYHPFREMETMLRGDNSNSNCVWKSCDPMNTQAVYGVEGDGQLSNCGMVNKEGIEWTKADEVNNMRDIILYQTSEEMGGCKGCEFFLLCNGYCPGSSQEGDWRNKTIYCSSLKRMFRHYENKLMSSGVTPFSRRDDRTQLEQYYLDSLMQNRGNPDIQTIEHYMKEKYEC